MKVFTGNYNNGVIYRDPASEQVDNDQVHLVLVFGMRSMLSRESVFADLRKAFPVAEIALASTAGEIYAGRVQDGTICITAIQFGSSFVKAAMVDIGAFDGDSFAAGENLAARFTVDDDLCYIMILSDGSSLVNGSELLKGIECVVQHRVPVTGGMAGDGIDFKATVVGLNGVPCSGRIVAVAFYGKSLVVSHGAMGGYEMFGPEITVTRSSGTRLYSINGQNALELYKKYLGPYAAQLPGSAMLFPLSVQTSGKTRPVVRTILSIDEEEGCMIFAGNIPEGARVRFMKANFDKLIDAASDAASATLKSLVAPEPRLALLISCVGRKIILEHRVDEEIEAIKEVYNSRTVLSGFYSYGEIGPSEVGMATELHNQTINITTFHEL